MQIIISHVNTDFDALASLVAAKKLHPEAHVVVSNKQAGLVKQFLNIYRDTFDFLTEKQVDWSEVSEIILVDVASLDRIGNFSKKLDRDSLHITVYDHHPQRDNDVKKDAGIIEQVGATVTILIEEIKRRSIQISSLEATLFGLGIYTDTGFFSFKNTTSRDLDAASFLMEKGLNLDIIQRFTEQTLEPEQQQLLDNLFIEAETYEINGLKIAVSSYQHDAFLGGLSTLTEKLLEIKGTDAAITVVGMNKHVFIVGRASSERISLLPLLKKWGGGGHKQAGSAMARNANREDVLNEVKENLSLILKPAVTAENIMTSPVKTISPNTTIEEAGDLMYRYKHSGYPVVEDEKLVGIVTRRDLDKANHHGLGHAPVKAYMSTNIITITKTTTLEEIQKIIIDHNIGRLPVVSNDKLIGIISRTDIIEAIHSSSEADFNDEKDKPQLIDNVANELKDMLDETVFAILKDISKLATQDNVPVYLIGGIVRDIFLQKDNDDIDIVVEGDGVAFAKSIHEQYGGELTVHENFGTATWIHPSQLEIDFATSRLEYYDKPASLPDVETSTLKEDLSRRDFTINAMAVCLNENKFGNLVDPFSGQADLKKGNITVLHNLSFVEDPTRIFRAVRFELRFNFKMDEQTEKLVHNSIEKVTDLSADRIMAEVNKLFKEHNEKYVIQRLFDLKFWHQFGVSNEHGQASCDHASALKQLYDNLPIKKVEEEIKLFSFFYIPFYYAKKEDIIKVFALTKQTGKFLHGVNALRKKQLPIVNKIGDFHQIFKGYSDEMILFLIANKSFTNRNLALNYLEARQNITTFLSGEDLQRQGLKPGPHFSTIFFELEVQVLNGAITSKDEATKWLQTFIAKNY